MAFERVYTVGEYYDGPRTGIANYSGKPHYYRSVEGPDEENEGIFILYPVDDATLQLALEIERKFQNWNVAYCRGEKDKTSHPILPGQDAEYANLVSEFKGRVSIPLTESCFVRGMFRTCLGQVDRVRGVQPELEVEWTLCSPPEHVY